MGRIERVQYQAAFAITGCWQCSNRNELYDELGRESFSDRRWSRRLIHFYKKYFVTVIRSIFMRIFPCLRIPIYGNRSRTSKYMNSLFPNCMKSWNNIGDELRNSWSLGRFKSNLLSLIRPAKKDMFGIPDPIGIKNIFRLRLGLSQLKVHKKRHNFLDTPCNQFAVLRYELLSDVLDILRKYNLSDLFENPRIYLYDHHEINIMIIGKFYLLLLTLYARVSSN